MIDDIKKICRKHPQFQKHIIDNILPNDKDFTIESLETFVHEFSMYKKLLKNKNYNFLSYNNLEQAFDNMSSIILESKAINFLKGQVSNKNKDLITNKTLSIIKDAVQENFDLNIIKDQVFKKIAKYKTSDSLNKAISQTIKNNTSELKEIYEKIEKSNSDVIKFDPENGLLIVQIKNYSDSNRFGSHSWCISTHKSFWESYLNRKTGQKSTYADVTRRFLKKHKRGNIENYQNLQFFVWDLKKINKESLVGFTYNERLKKQASHWRDDTYCSKEIFSYIKKSDLEKKLIEKNQIVELKGEKIIQAVKDTGIEQYSKPYNLALILMDLDIEYCFKYMIDQNLDFNNKTFSQRANTIFSTSKILEHNILDLAIKYGNDKKIVVNAFSTYSKKSGNDFEINYLLKGATNLFDGNVINKDQYELLSDNIKLSYIKSLSTITIENPSIKALTENYFKKADFSDYKQYNGVLNKVLKRSIKNNDLEWFSKIMKNQKVSMKILSTQDFREYLSAGKRTQNKEEKDIMFEQILADKIDFNSNPLTPVIKYNINKTCSQFLKNTASFTIPRSQYINQIQFVFKIIESNCFDSAVTQTTFNQISKILNNYGDTLAISKDFKKKLKTLKLSTDLDKWSNIIIKNKPFDKTEWNKLKGNDEFMIILKEKIEKEMEGLSLIEDVLKVNRKQKILRP